MRRFLLAVVIVMVFSTFSAGDILLDWDVDATGNVIVSVGDVAIRYPATATIPCGADRPNSYVLSEPIMIKVGNADWISLTRRER